MTGTDSEGATRLRTVRRYRRAMVAAVVVGVVGFAVADELGRPLVGLAVYWAGILAFVGVWKGTAVALFDERDAALERRASLLTLKVLAVAGVLSLTALVTVEEAMAAEIPERVWGAYLALSGVFVVYGAAYLLLRYRR